MHRSFILPSGTQVTQAHTEHDDRIELRCILDLLVCQINFRPNPTAANPQPWSTHGPDDETHHLDTLQEAVADADQRLQSARNLHQQEQQQKHLAQLQLHETFRQAHTQLDQLFQQPGSTGIPRRRAPSEKLQQDGPRSPA